MIEIPMQVLAEAIEHCKEINMTRNTEASFKMAAPVYVGAGNYKYRELRFLQKVNGWVMMVGEDE